ncbi:PadR family transcriptional regulator [Crossiella cryophila]|uniref:DNA-binding PadR family transcriptional regulator n=1 Tax=Crossiella cryophila TaxID=43355 RepID=A0A7W7FRG2_9PSEU|nr:PadR family transcriptional regulator [Crossiella cryophila]MBB4674900.1 DNA-binding PadR family transcriptional regulator [Crossiella cryophila]
MLELAILGILHRAPMHGYELRKQLGCLLCGHRPAFSFGSLYPTLRRLQRAGLIAEDGGEPSASAGRARRVYGLSAAGREHFAGLLAEVTPQHWEDDCFGVRLAFFSRTPPEARLRILAGRRRCVAERQERIRSTLDRSCEHVDHYTRQLQRLGLDGAEREVRWLDELIEAEHRQR